MEECSNRSLKFKKRQHFNLSYNHIANVSIKSLPEDMLSNTLMLYTFYKFQTN